MAEYFTHMRYVFPKLKQHQYAVWMKTLHNSLTFDASDIAKFRLHVLDHMQVYGWKSATNAFGVKKSTLYDWRKRYFEGSKHLAVLVPQSTRPHHVREMWIDPRLVNFIRQCRKEYGNLDKRKIKIFLDTYAQELQIAPVSESVVGKVIRRYHFFFEGKHKIRRASTLTQKRVKYAPKAITPGYVEMDSVIMWVSGKKYCFMTAIDIVTKVAWCQWVTGTTAKQARATLQVFKTQCGSQIHTIQTDNGSEFYAEFDQYIQDEGMTHSFITPHSPKINGCIERFNRTIQEECLLRSEALLTRSGDLIPVLKNYLNWYNECRPHASLAYQTPRAFIQTHFPECL